MFAILQHLLSLVNRKFNSIFLTLHSGFFGCVFFGEHFYFTLIRTSLSCLVIIFFLYFFGGWHIFFPRYNVWKVNNDLSIKCFRFCFLFLRFPQSGRRL